MLPAVVKSLPLYLVLLPLASFAQEVSIDALPRQMQQPIPDRVVYHMFLRHVAAFERQAEQAEANGQDPGPWRKHILHRFGLTPEEQQKITPIALSYETQWRAIHEQEEAVIQAYKARYFPTGTWPKGRALPPRSTELMRLRATSSSLTLRTKQQVIATLGAQRFSELDGTIHSHLGIQSLAAWQEQKTQTKGVSK